MCGLNDVKLSVFVKKHYVFVRHIEFRYKITIKYAYVYSCCLLSVHMNMDYKLSLVFLRCEQSYIIKHNI